MIGSTRLLILTMFLTVTAAFAADNEQRKCDVLAAAPFDPMRADGVSAVQFKDIDAVAAVAACRAAIESGSNNQRYYFQLGRALEKSGAYAEAAQLYEQAANSGYPRAIGNLVNLYLDGTGVQKNDAKAVEWAKKGVRAGDLSSMTTLGNLYSWGRGLDKDEREAFRLWQLAANGDYTPAQSRLGVAYIAGIGVGVNAPEGARQFRLSAAAGDAEGMDNFGVVLMNGQGVDQNKAEAVQWFSKAAKLGSRTAMRHLAAAYDVGQGVGKDSQQAYEWNRRAAELGDVEAMADTGVALSTGEGVEQNASEGFQWLKKAADVGDMNAMKNVAASYANGMGVEKNEVEALRWLKKAADGGSVIAMRLLGATYLTGTMGQPKDNAAALQWLNRAASAGDKRAQYYVNKEFSKKSLRNLPTTEQFMGMVSACATSNKIQISGDLEGSVKSFYEGVKGNGQMSISQSSEFLSLFPEAQRTDAYKVYINCILSVTSSYQNALVQAADVRLLRNDVPASGLDVDSFIALSEDAIKRIQSFKSDNLIDDHYFVTFSLSCGERKGPFLFQYKKDMFESFNAIVARAYDLTYNDQSELPQAEDYIRTNGVIYAVDLRRDFKKIFKELSDDVKVTLGESKCSVSDFKIDLYLLITTVGLDGFDETHFFLLTGTLSGVVDNEPEPKFSLNHSEKAEYLKAVAAKVSFDYSRLEVWKSTNPDRSSSKLLFGRSSVKNGVEMMKYDPNFVQPTVAFLRTLKQKPKRK